MTTGLKIKDVADASGFTAATLRYYEQIGLLPEAQRTASGYRVYDDRTVNRLAFIARAKQLGCTLDEITSLTTAWDGGQCGPVQDRLRQLVAAKIGAARQQITDLSTFAHELHQAAAALELHRPNGACDSSCGCVGAPQLTPTVADTQQSISLSVKPVADSQPVIACTLSAGSLKGRIDDWTSLLAHVDRRDYLDGGIRLSFSATVPTEALIALVAAEQGCCQFFEFAITVDTRGIALEVRAPATAQSIVASMFGAPS
jgi:MerR family transcriptional regulator, copper efflux regulator